jgi:hypothetical protein
MTHDELLAKINWWIKGVNNFVNPEEACDCNKCELVKSPYYALRAVVELHKPARCNQDCCDVCSHCFEMEGERADIYPCPTIKAIEKVLND